MGAPPLSKQNIIGDETAALHIRVSNTGETKKEPRNWETPRKRQMQAGRKKRLLPEIESKQPDVAAGRGRETPLTMRKQKNKTKRIAHVDAMRFGRSKQRVCHREDALGQN